MTNGLQPDDGGRGAVIWEALRREAGLTAEHLGIGATAIGNADYERTATYAQAFFALSVGFERAAKLALTLDAALANDGAFLDGAALRRFGHRLDGLLDSVADRADARGVALAQRPSTGIHRAIIAALTDFAANVNRYYNLEILAAASVTAHDPIAVWHTTVTRPVLAAHYTEGQRRRDEERAAAISVPATTMVWVVATGETGEPVRDLEDVMLRGARGRVARPWERMYILQLARYVTRVIGEFGVQAQAKGMPVPFLEEYFQAFQVDDADFRSRKTWLLSF
ncbi:MAG: hypothetical protein WKF96_06685 [Solirubrobacteraceae bacterium]